MRRLTLARTDFLTRVNVYIDANARKLSAVDVDLPGYSVRLFDIYAPDAWSRIMAAAEQVRAKYNADPVRPLSILQPFVHVVAFDAETETVAQCIDADLRIAESHPEHEVRVDALEDAVDLLMWFDGKPSAVKFAPVH
jgi:hypothetical protein